MTSKKPVAPISQAMKQGDEPLRSFSDLLQFYESKRSDDAPASVQVQPVQSYVEIESSLEVVDFNSEIVAASDSAGETKKPEDSGNSPPVSIAPEISESDDSEAIEPDQGGPSTR